MRHTVRAFTAIEMIVVVSIVIMLVAMSAPSIFTYIKRGRVNEAAETMFRANSQARQLARTKQLTPENAYYGVAVDCSAWPITVYLTYGSINDGSYDQMFMVKPWTWNTYAEYSRAPSKAEAKLMSRMQPVALFTFNRNVQVLVDKKPFTGKIWWGLEYRTSKVIVENTTGTAKDKNLKYNIGYSDVGVSDSTYIKDLLVASQDMKILKAIAIYSIGLGNIDEGTPPPPPVKTPAPSPTPAPPVTP